MSKLKTQLATSLTSDFQENTWTFELDKDFKVTAGGFAIVPRDKYEKLLVAVKGICRSVMAHPEYEEDSEFFDMVSRCVNAINDLED
jgi:uncharacterized protein YfaQ (DUF2300 family)